MNKSLETHFEGKVAQKVILIKGDSVLITRDSRDEIWELPGGRLNVGENPESGVTREVAEELGVVVKIGQPVYINQFKHSEDKTDALVIVYLATLEDESAEFVVDPIEVAQMQWVDKQTWDSYDYYPEYQVALSEYFTAV